MGQSGPAKAYSGKAWPHLKNTGPGPAQARHGP